MLTGAQMIGEPSIAYFEHGSCWRASIIIAGESVG